MKTSILKSTVSLLFLVNSSAFALDAGQLKACQSRWLSTLTIGLPNQLVENKIELEKRGLSKASVTLTEREALLRLSLANPNGDLQEALQLLHKDLKQEAAAVSRRQTTELEQLSDQLGGTVPMDDSRSLELHAQTVSALGAIEEAIELRNLQLTAQDIESALLQIHLQRINRQCK